MWLAKLCKYKCNATGGEKEACPIVSPAKREAMSLLGLSLFQLLGVYVALCAIFMYVIIMGPSRYHRGGAIGVLYRWTMQCPNVFGSAMCCLLCCCRRTRGREVWARCYRKVMYERHWGMVAFYVLVIGGMEILYLTHRTFRATLSSSRSLSVMIDGNQLWDPMWARR